MKHPESEVEGWFKAFVKEHQPQLAEKQRIHEHPQSVTGQFVSLSQKALAVVMEGPSATLRTLIIRLAELEAKENPLIYKTKICHMNEELPREYIVYGSCCFRVC